MRVARAKNKSDVKALTYELEQSAQKKMALELDMGVKDKEVKHQMLLVKQLTRTCDELTANNKRLEEACMFYQRAVKTPKQPTAPVTTKPSCTTHRTIKESIIVDDSSSDTSNNKGVSFFLTNSESESVI